MSVRIGINPLDDLAQVGRVTTLETWLTEGKRAGYSGFELAHVFPRKPEVLGPILDSHQLSLVSGWFSGQLLERSVEEEIEAIQDHLQLLKKLGAEVLVYCDVTGDVGHLPETPVSHRPVLEQDRWEEYGSRLTQVADYCLEQGVRVVYHHHMGTFVQSESDIDALMANTGESVSLLLDAGHLEYAGGDSLAIQLRHSDRIFHVHCKDIRSKVMIDALNRDLSFHDAVLNGVFTVPGDGDFDFLSLFKGLKTSNYSGWVVIEAEQDPTVADPLKYARLGFNNLSTLLENAGIEISK